MTAPRTKSHSILIDPKFDISIYEGYNYFHEACTFEEIEGRKHLTLPIAISKEWLFTASRFIAFTDILKMKPFNWKIEDSATYNNLMGVFYTTRDIGFSGNTSFLQDYDGTPYCLIEPYYYPLDWEAQLKAVGMVGIMVPKSIAPYHDCKLWPEAASFLVTPYIMLNEMRFSTIKAKLLEAESLYV